MAELKESEDPVLKLCNEGGLAVGFETVCTLHQCTYSDGEEELGEENSVDPNILQWEVIGHGIPAVVVNKNGVALCLADIESGDKLCSFTISTASQYTVYSEEFHIFTKPSGCFGLEFSNSSVAKVLFACLKRTITPTRDVPVENENVEENEGIEPAPKRLCAESDDDEEDLGEDQPDGIVRRSTTKKRKRQVEISEPQDFHHVAHVGVEASILELTQTLSWKGTLEKQERISSHVISIPNSTKNEEAANAPPPPPVAALPPPPPPPPAVAPPPPKIEFKKKKDSASVANKPDPKSSLIDEIKKGVLLRPVNDDSSSCGSHESVKTTYSSIQEELKYGFVLKTRSRTMTLPMPPKKKESQKLMFEIKTFRRTRLRDISMTDFPARAAPPADDSLESILKKRLDAMRNKISDSGEFSNTGIVDNNGEDTFDGNFFSDN